MTDELISDVPEEEEQVEAVDDDQARRLGLSRSGYLRSALAREHQAAVSIAELGTFAERCADLDDAGVMGDGWS